MNDKPLKLISSMAVRGVLKELAAEYQKLAGRAVAAEAAGGVDVTRRLQDGEAADVIVLASKSVDKLLESGVLLAGSRMDFVRSGVAVVVPAGKPTPDISTEEALKAAVLSARSLSYSTGPSGVHLEQTFARWGILDTIRERIVVPRPGVPVGSLVAEGKAELGFQQLSELLNLDGVDVIGPLPPDVQTITVFAGAVSAKCEQPEPARSLLDYLVSDATVDTKKRHGMEPA